MIGFLNYRDAVVFQMRTQCFVVERSGRYANMVDIATAHHRRSCFSPAGIGYIPQYDQ